MRRRVMRLLDHGEYRSLHLLCMLFGHSPNERFGRDRLSCIHCGRWLS